MMTQEIMNTVNILQFSTMLDDGLAIPMTSQWARWRLKSPGPRLNIKTVLSAYGDFHVKDKTAVRTSYL